MLPVLLILFVLVPIAELYVIIQVGQAIGVLPTIAILVADSIIGAVLLRSQGRAAWRRFNAAVSEGRIPTREVLDGVLVIAGAFALLTPGFITDAHRRAVAASPDPGGDPPAGARPRRRAHGGVGRELGRRTRGRAVRLLLRCAPVL